MASGRTVARYNGSSWSTPFTLNFEATDLAVSPYGDVAVAGYDYSTDSKSVAWFDFAEGKWIEQRLGSQNKEGRVDIEWDKYGNLGVAYSDVWSASVKFDYLDMETSSWTSEVVSTQQCGQMVGPGAALAFDRFGRPVIACGSTIYYDPTAVPEPASMLVLVSGLAGLAWRRRARGK
jgi:hypothetical protein